MKTSNIQQGRAHQEAIIRGWVSNHRAGGTGVTVTDGFTDAPGTTTIVIVGGTVVDDGDGTITITVDSGPLDWFDVTDYGALGDGSTDDTVAIQDTIDACYAAGGGTVFFPAGLYVVGGALQDTGAFNGQLLLPDVSHTGDHIVMTFKGALRPGFHPVYGDTVPLADGLSVIKSTLTGGTGTASVFSGGNDTGSPSAGHGNNLEVYIDDLVCLGPNNPTFTFWNLAACQGGGVGALQISTPGAFAGSATQPTNTNAYGIKLPGQYMANTIDVGTLSVGGFYTGVLDGELTTYRNVILGPLIYGIEFPTTFYPSLVLRCQPTQVQRVLKGTGDHRVDVIQYVAEHSTSPAWAVTVYDVDDASNHLYGYIRWYNAATGGAPDDLFTVNGASNLGNQEMGSAWGSVTVKEEGVALATPATSIDFVGSAVTASGTGAAKTVTISASSGTGQHILLADGHATPFVFTDLLQMDDGSDFMWSDPE